MAAIVRATLLLLCVALPLSAQQRSLALYTGPANGLHPSALRAAEAELHRLLTPTGVEAIWKNLAKRKSGEHFDYVIVASFDGACNMDQPAQRGKGSSSLAASAVSNGKVLPFLRIDCHRLMQMMDLAVREMTMRERDTAIGVAIARVIAHEIYHILAQTTAHQDRGVAKSSFTTQDLTIERFEFDIFSVAQMRPMLAAGYTDSSGR